MLGRFIMLLFVLALGIPCRDVPSSSQSGEEDVYIRNFMDKSKRFGGTFVEIGALDGHVFSNTRKLNKCFHWNGILIEANLKNYVKLVNKLDRPNVTVMHSAVCDRSGWTTFTVDGDAVSTDVTRVSESFQRAWAWSNRPSNVQKVPCNPMHKLLRDIPHVDFFSIDVEGAEFAVVSTIDFDKITVDTFCIEFDGHDKAKDQRVVSHLLSKGYKICTVPDLRNKWFRKDCA